MNTRETFPRVSRRALGILGLGAMLGMVPFAHATPPKPKPYPLGGPPPAAFHLWLQRLDTGEECRAVYARGGVLDVEGYTRICHCMRDIQERKGPQTVRMDVKLLNLLFGIQQWLAVHGVQRPLVITCGYRSPRTNAATEGAEKDSMHTKGQAVDFTVEGLSPVYLGRLVSFFREGGVGMYPSRYFVHVDTGKVREWRG